MPLTFLSAVLFYLSFPNIFSMHGYWPCIWFFAVPLLLALRKLPLKKRVGYLICWGFCAYGLMAQGVFRISPAGFFAFVGGLSMQALIFALIFKASENPLMDVFYIPCAWSISEFLRNSLLGGFSFYISHAHAFCPAMLGLYSKAGCLGMSFMIMLVNALIFLSIDNFKKRWQLLIAAGIVFLSVFIFGIADKAKIIKNPKMVRISVIQANISPSQKADLTLFDRNVAKHLDLTRQSARGIHPDLVIWPETAFPDDILKDKDWRPIILFQAKYLKTALLLGMAPVINGREYNSALLIDRHGAITGMYHKQALVPFAETTPFEEWGIRWGRGYHFAAGNQLGMFNLESMNIKFGVVICSESAHPLIVQQLRRAGAQMLVEMSNDGWFTDKASLMLHAQAAIMRAVENHMWVIRAANTGFSFAVDPNGIIHEGSNLKLGHEGFGIFDIMIENL